jgi:hypothetical protein
MPARSLLQRPSLAGAVPARGEELSAQRGAVGSPWDGGGEEIRENVGKAIGLFGVGEVPGSVEDLETAAGQLLVGGFGVGDRDDGVPGACDEQDGGVGEQVEGWLA